MMIVHSQKEGMGRSRAMSIAARWLGVALLSFALGCAGLGGSKIAKPTGGDPADKATPIPVDGPPEFHVLVGQELEAEGRLGEALAAYQRALQANAELTESGEPEAVVDPDADPGFLHRRVAELAARQNQLELALEHAELALAGDPDDEGVQLFLGTLYRFRRDVPNAERVLTHEDGSPTSSAAATLLFGILSEAKRHDDARDVAQWLVDSDPDALRSFLALAEAESRLGRPDEAEAVLRRGLIAHPGELSLYGALARGRKERDDREGEIAIHREILGEHPGHTATLLAKADAELALGLNDEARATLRRVEKDSPRDLRTILRLGFLDFEQNDFPSAAGRFRRALVLQPKQVEIAYFLAVALRSDGQDEEAEKYFLQVTSEHPRYSESRTQLASLAEKRGEFESAMAYVEEARAANPGRPLDLYLASLRAKAGDPDAALVELLALLDDSAEDADVLYNIGIIHGEADNIDEAVRTMQSVLSLDPEHAGALNYLGYTWAERGENLDEAEEMIERALEQRPGDGFITDSLGWIYYMRARPLVEAGRIQQAQSLIERAKEELEKASKLTGGDPVIFEHLGDVFLLQGDRDQALQHYESAVDAGPRPAEQPNLQQKLDELRQELGPR